MTKEQIIKKKSPAFWKQNKLLHITHKEESWGSRRGLEKPKMPDSVDIRGNKSHTTGKSNS